MVGSLCFTIWNTRLISWLLDVVLCITGCCLYGLVITTFWLHVGFSYVFEVF